MRALSIRQPYAELILRGIKTIEYRTQPTRLTGERFHIYAPLKQASADPKLWSRDLAVPTDALPPWMIELAEQVGMIERELLTAGVLTAGAVLPVGVIVGSAIIDRCVPLPASSLRHAQGRLLRPHPYAYAWHLSDVQRAKRLLKPTGHPQPVWFEPFRPLGGRRGGRRPASA